jgi:hypothetical protein
MLNTGIRGTIFCPFFQVWGVCGSGMFMSDLGSEFFRPGSRIQIRIKEFKYLFLSPEKYFYALGKIILDVHSGYGFFPHPGSRIRIQG